MSTTLMVGLYFVIWWTILFAILPFGVRSQAEAGDVVPGTEPAAPARPHLVKKALWTSVISAVILALVWAVLEYRLIPSVLPAHLG